MKVADREKLEAGGAWYNPSSQFDKSKAIEFRVNNKGWYVGQEYIGFTIKEALDWLHNNRQ